MPPSVARLEAEPITLETVRAVAKANFDAGYRFVTLSVHNLGDGNLDIIFRHIYLIFLSFICHFLLAYGTG